LFFDLTLGTNESRAHDIEEQRLTVADEDEHSAIVINRFFRGEDNFNWTVLGQRWDNALLWLDLEYSRVVCHDAERRSFIAVILQKQQPTLFLAKFDITEVNGVRRRSFWIFIDRSRRTNRPHFFEQGNLWRHRDSLASERGESSAWSLEGVNSILSVM
jgi:hypothetical protein